MTFSLTAGKSSVLSQEDKNSSSDYQRLYEVFLKEHPTWLDDQGFGGIQAQVVTSSSIFPALEFSNPGKARGFDFWFNGLEKDSGPVSDAGARALSQSMPLAPRTGGIDPVPGDFTNARCKPVYWEETVSDPVDLFDNEGAKIGYKIVTTGAGYTTTNHYTVEGVLSKTAYHSMFGAWSETSYKPITKEGQTYIQTDSSGESGDFTWTSYQLSDAENNLLESRYEDSSGYKSSTLQEYKKSEDGSITKIIISSEGTGAVYSYTSFTEYDGKWNVIKSDYSDSNGNKSSTERTFDNTTQEYTVISSGAGPNGYAYQSKEILDERGNLLENSYKDSSGYYSQRTTEKQIDAIWGAVFITKDITGNEQQADTVTYRSTNTYTPEWRLIASETTDSYGYSSRLTTTIETSTTGEKLYVQTYQFTYAGGSTSEWVTQYNEDWWPIVDGKPVEQLPLLWKAPIAASTPEPEILPAVERSAVTDFQEKIVSVSDTISNQVITGIKGQRDKLSGTEVNDTFMVNDKADRVIAGQKGDSDSVMTEEFNLDLRARQWDGIENAMLAGARRLNLTGDAGANILSGNGVDNVIRGGSGKDTLFGGGGDDVFVVTKEKKKTFDTIVDFESGEDKIALNGTEFRTLFDKNKLLKDGVIGERLKLDNGGILWFDPDGVGRKAAVEIAMVGISDTLNKADFMYVS